MERLTYTVDEAAKLLGISRNVAYEGVARGEIPHIRVGRRILIGRKQFHRYLEGKQDGSTG